MFLSDDDVKEKRSSRDKTWLKTGKKEEKCNCSQPNVWRTYQNILSMMPVRQLGEWV